MIIVKDTVSIKPKGVATKFGYCRACPVNKDYLSSI